MRARVAFRELAADRPAIGTGATSRRDARMILRLARPAIDAFRAVRVIEPCGVHGAPPVAWIMRQFLIHLPFNRPQERGEPGLAFGQQLAHVPLVLPGRTVPGPVGPSLNVSAHKASPGVDVIICRSRRPRKHRGAARSRARGGHQEPSIVEEHDAVAEQAPALPGVACQHARSRPIRRRGARAPGLMLAGRFVSHLMTIARDRCSRPHGRPPDPTTGWHECPGPVIPTGPGGGPGVFTVDTPK